MIEFTARFRLLSVGSSGLRGWCWRRSPSLGLRLSCRPPRPAALLVMREYASASLCLAHFGGGKMCQTPCVLSLSKIIKLILCFAKDKKVLFILQRRRKKYKGVFARLRMRVASRREAKSFLDAKRGRGNIPLTQSLSRCTGYIRLRRISLPALRASLFPYKGIGLIR